MKARIDGVPEVQPVNLTQFQGVAPSTQNPIPVTDKPNVMEATQATLVAGTSTAFTFSAAVEVVRIKNWSTTDRVLVKSSAISSDTDASASRVGKAPTTDVPNSEFYPVSGTIYLRCAAAAEVTVEGFKKT